MIEQIRVLLVEDDRDYRVNLAKMMIMFGLDLDVAENFASAQKFILRAKKYKVLVTDNYLPEKDQGNFLSCEMNKVNQELLVVNISSGSLGAWNDPNYLPGQPFPGLTQYDINGRKSLKTADLSGEYDSEKIIDWIRTNKFVLRNPDTIRHLQEMTRRFAR